jgi:hypothetical protein
VSTLVRKLKHAHALVSASEDAYEALTESASEADLEAWKQGEHKAQDNRDKDVQSMDYFTLKTKQGEIFLKVMLRYGALPDPFCSSRKG